MKKQDKNFLTNMSPLLIAALVMLFMLFAREANGKATTQNYESNILKELPLELITEGKTSQ
jgi:hypothetical protein